MPGPSHPVRDALPPEPPQRARSLPPWMDRNNEFGDMKFLVLEPLKGFKLPQNPWIISKSITNVVGELTESSHSMEFGQKYLIKTRNLAQYTKMQSITQLIDGTKVSITPHATLNTVQCVIFAPELKGLKDEEILLNMESQNVKQVRRFTRKVNDEIQPTNSFLIRVEAGKIPESLRVGLLQVRTKPYYPKPMLCYKCASFGHTKVRCSKGQVCGNCGTAAHGECSTHPACVNCKGEHSAFSRECPAFQFEEQVIKIKVDHNCTYKEARQMALQQHQQTSAVQQRITFAQQTTTVDEKDIKIKRLEEEQNELKKTILEQMKKMDTQSKLIEALLKKLKEPNVNLQNNKNNTTNEATTQIEENQSKTQSNNVCNSNNYIEATDNPETDNETNDQETMSTSDTESENSAASIISAQSRKRNHNLENVSSEEEELRNAVKNMASNEIAVISPIASPTLPSEQRSPTAKPSKKKHRH
ncbi:uncharacterized protein LOC121601180 [Anopheles merus]|uniref:uncharacterized protein LOC121601180 n=1 Tax=Anopheles merus TaxID=30066 RepID=UPI001BE43074|nr:uncharacterized protein LOC121601180 [Anopheles merus]